MTASTKSNRRVRRRWQPAHVAGLFAALGCAIWMPAACSLTSLEELQSGSDTDAGEGGNPGTGSGAEGGRSTAGGNAASGAAGDPGGIGGDTGSAGDPSSAGEGASAGDAGAPAGGAGGTGPGGTAGTSGTAGVPGIVYGVVGQSCAGGLVCGDGVDCCDPIEVPAGTYTMGTSTDANRNADEAPAHTAEVSAFLLDRFEVTVGRFRRFVNAFDGTLPEPGSGAHSVAPDSGWQLDFATHMPASRVALTAQVECGGNQYATWTEVPGVRETMPLNCVSWYVAFAFCIWDGGRLPTEAEWEKAATGGAEDLRFPWGNATPVPATHAIMDCLADGTAGCQPTDLLPVGSRPSGAGKWGHLDLGGSLWEWTLDYYDDTYYQAIGTCEDCVNLAGTTPRAIRGGNFTGESTYLRATMRASKPPTRADPYAGFRCARVE